MIGPISDPTNCPVPSHPNDEPSRCSGTCVDTSSVAAELNPASAPMPARIATMCQGLCARPISNVKIAIPSVDRSTISFRP